VLEVGLGLPQPPLHFGDLCAQVVGQGPGGVLLDVECLAQGLDGHAGTACASRRVAVCVPVGRRALTWVIAQWAREAEEAGVVLVGADQAPVRYQDPGGLLDPPPLRLRHEAGVLRVALDGLDADVQAGAVQGDLVLEVPADQGLPGGVAGVARRHRPAGRCPRRRRRCPRPAR
jgi:hypothetical protein